MPHWKKSFPSKYVQSADLETPVVVTITRVSNENVGAENAGELKPVAYFKEIPKGVVLNLTRAEAIATIAGDDDMDAWPNVRVQLQRGWTRYQGKRVACIEIVAPPAPAPRAKRTKPAPPPIEEPDDLASEDAPF